MWTLYTKFNRNLFRSFWDER